MVLFLFLVHLSLVTFYFLINSFICLCWVGRMEKGGTKKWRDGNIHIFPSCLACVDGKNYRYYMTIIPFIRMKNGGFNHLFLSLEFFPPLMEGLFWMERVSLCFSIPSLFHSNLTIDLLHLRALFHPSLSFLPLFHIPNESLKSYYYFLAYWAEWKRFE